MSDASKSHSMRKRNDLGLVAVVITADADPADIDPPKIGAATSDFVFIFIRCSKKDSRTIFIADVRMDFIFPH
jgi:hypothetical protein